MTIQPNPEIEVIVSSAIKSAKELNHEYVTLEHLLKAVMLYKPFYELCQNFGADVDSMVIELHHFLLSQTYLVSKENGCEPKKTHALERMFNRAFTQVLFSGRTHIQVIDIFLSITNETNSHAAYFMLKYGLDRQKLIEFYNENYQEAKQARAARKMRDRKSTRLNSSHIPLSRMPSSA